MVKAVIFDLDNTLYDFSNAHEVGMEALKKRATNILNVTEEDFLRAHEAGRSVIKRQHFGAATEHHRLLYIELALEVLDKQPTLYAIDLYETYWGAFLDAMKLYRGAMDFLKALKANGVKTAICTDMTSHIQYRKLKKLGIADYIDRIVTSEEARVEKPGAIMFQMALDKVGANPRETVYIGDSYERDVEGAVANAITPVWFVADRPHGLKDVLTVENYSDERLFSICGL